MRETGAPDGFAYAEEIPFTVSEDGTVERISMQDKPTHVEITKYSVTGEKELPGARMELWEEKERRKPWLICGYLIGAPM